MFDLVNSTRYGPSQGGATTGKRLKYTHGLAAISGRTATCKLWRIRL
jgi:hypothetical protein